MKSIKFFRVEPRGIQSIEIRCFFPRLGLKGKKLKGGEEIIHDDNWSGFKLCTFGDYH